MAVYLAYETSATPIITSPIPPGHPYTQASGSSICRFSSDSGDQQTPQSRTVTIAQGVAQAAVFVELSTKFLSDTWGGYASGIYWYIPIDVTTANSNLTITSWSVHRYSSTGTWLEVIYPDTSTSVSLSTTGLKSVFTYATYYDKSVTRGDILYGILNVYNVAAHSAQAFAFNHSWHTSPIYTIPPQEAQALMEGTAVMTPAHADALFGDTFTDADYTWLYNHISEGGGGWTTGQSGSANTAYILNNRVYIPGEAS